MELIFSIWTVLVLVIFLGVAFWAYSSKRKDEFEQAARMVLDDNDIQVREDG